MARLEGGRPEAKEAEDGPQDGQASRGVCGMRQGRGGGGGGQLVRDQGAVGRLSGVVWSGYE
jgi:hypothetical protein